MSNDKLPPCPHCGEDEFEDYLWPPPGDYSVRCKYCGALGPPCSTWKQAREAYNERAIKITGHILPDPV